MAPCSSSYLAPSELAAQRSPSWLASTACARCSVGTPGSSPTMALPRSPARSTRLARRERRGSTLLHVQRTLRALRAEAPNQYALVTNHMRRAPGKYLVGPERFTVTVDD